MPLRVLVTGGAGFFGRHVCQRLRDHGHEVRVLDRQPAPEWAGPLGVGWARADVTDRAAVREEVARADRVVHAAFAPPERPLAVVRSVNVAGTAAVLSAAGELGGTPVVLVSSTIVDREVRAHPLLPGAPVSRLHAYAVTRRAAERQAREAPVPVAVVRPKTFLGPGAVGAFAVLLGLVQAGGVVPVLGTGRNRYQLLDVRDFAAGIEVLARQGAAGVFGLGAEPVGTVREELGELLDHAGTGARLGFVPAPLARLALGAVSAAGLAPLSEWHRESAAGRDSVLDTSAARALGWAPEHTGGQALVASYDSLGGLSAVGQAVHPVPLVHRVLARTAARFPGTAAARSG